MMFSGTLVLLALAGALPPVPRFSAYPVLARAPHRLAAPRLVTAEQRRFRTVLRDAVRKGYGVVNGGTEHERPGPNFAGSYLLVQWSCGLNCNMGALIDGRSGVILPLPTPSGSDPHNPFRLSTAGTDLRGLQFRSDSRLIGIPAVADARTYFYSLEQNRWHAVGSR